MKIGKVILDLEHHDESLHYSDGDIEEELLQIVKTNASYERILLHDNRWPIVCHLSKERENILNWFPFSGAEDVLEIGSGCGALTGLLSQKCHSVTCNDISLRRSEINAYKNSDCDNVEILVGNFSAMDFKKQFDVITLIGVLEYSAFYTKGVSPFHTMLDKVRTMMRPGGKLILAIENKFGLKYWAGCKEDHTARFYEGLEGYPNTKEIRTFSKRELSNMLEKAGYHKNCFYYPLPDYKFPKAIFSDDRPPRRGEIRDPERAYDQERLKTFDEIAVYNQLIEEKMFGFFANSFLVISEV